MAMHLDSYLGSLSLIFFFAWFLTSPAEAAMKKYQFDIKVKNVNRLCHAKPIVTVNGRFPGPTIFVREGDRVLVNVTNHAQYNMSSHWHGLKQFRNGWADGPAYITQCPIKTEHSYTYNFNVTGQRGTLWWHAHILWLRATIYDTLAMEVEAGKTYLLRIINVVLNDELFFAIAGYNMTVVEIDAIYTKPFTTRVILIAPVPVDNKIVTAILQYKGIPNTVLPSVDTRFWLILLL
ncbi:Laccase 11, putative [Theobroma cacao]|uniref:Laccase 11, putative n=1 Tax=Theobroma cacao TaxID=3641 RepID=A0A061ETW4_THECC|nr:Laccase 11, putative [Theobroma cacao]